MALHLTCRVCSILLFCIVNHTVAHMHFILKGAARTAVAHYCKLNSRSTEHSPPQLQPTIQVCTGKKTQ